MPTYSYECQACKHTLEQEQRISEAPLRKCPECGKAKLKRLISGGNFILKGGGWYSDGYGLKQGSSSGGSKDGGESSSSSSSSSSSTPSSSTPSSSTPPSAPSSSSS